MAVSAHMHRMPPAPVKGSGGPRSAPSQHPHAVPPHHPPAPAHKVQPPAKKSHAVLYSLLALAVLAAAGGTWWAMKARGPAEPTPEALVLQIEDTAISSAPKANIYGGMIFSDHGNPASVTVGGIPNQACVSAGWRLARSGIVTINGIMPQRISAAILTELCNQENANALSWTAKTE